MFSGDLTGCVSELLEDGRIIVRTADGREVRAWPTEWTEVRPLLCALCDEELRGRETQDVDLLPGMMPGDRAHRGCVVAVKRALGIEDRRTAARSWERESTAGPWAVPNEDRHVRTDPGVAAAPGSMEARVEAAPIPGPCATCKDEKTVRVRFTLPNGNLSFRLDPCPACSPREVER